MIALNIIGPHGKRLTFIGPSQRRIEQALRDADIRPKDYVWFDSHGAIAEALGSGQDAASSLRLRPNRADFVVW